jgi:hypothetical protein
MQDWLSFEQEPPLDDMFEDPIIRALMASDRVEPSDVVALLCRARDPDHVGLRAA